MNKPTGITMPGRVAIRLLDYNGQQFKGDVYIREWNHDDNGKFTERTFTRHAGQAMTFPDQAAAKAFWYGQSRSQPLRPLDGKPNRPMTAFTPLFESVEQDVFWHSIVNNPKLRGE